MTNEAVRVSRATVTWDRDLVFSVATGGGRSLTLDAADEAGPCPVDVMLSSLGGCMAIDVVMILGKMRCPPARFAMDIEAESAPVPPRYLRRVKMTLTLAGEGIDESKVERAVSLSRGTYCSVLATMRPDIDVLIGWRIEE